MRITTTAFISWMFAFVGIGFMAVQANADDLQLFKTPMDKVNYVIGVETIRNSRNQGLEVNLDLLIKGLQDGMSGNVVIPEKELRRIMTSYQTEQRQKRGKEKRDAALKSSKNAELELKPSTEK